MTSLRTLLVRSSRCLIGAIPSAALLAGGLAAGVLAANLFAAEAIVTAPDGRFADNNAKPATDNARRATGDVKPAAGAVKSAGNGAKAAAGSNAGRAAKSVEMFAAMKSGELDVKFIPKNDREARVFLKNNTKQPLNVKLPEAFAGVPVLAQRRGRGGGGAGGMGGGGMGMMNQGMGGGMGGMGMGGMGGGGMGGGGMGGGGGMFNIPPEQVRQIVVDTVCLDHGKKDPRPAAPYEIHPIESYTTKPGVAELCALLGHGQIDQRAAQVAAWHLNSGLTWDELAAKRIEHLDGESEPYFLPYQLQMGVAASNAAEAIAAESAASGADRKPAPQPVGTPAGESASQR